MRLIDLLIGVGVGLLDEAAEGKKIKISEKTEVGAEEIVRPVLFAGALAVDLLNIGGRTVKEVAEALEVASAPLLTKMVMKKVKASTTQTTSQKTYVVYTPPPQPATPAPASAPRTIAAVTSY